MILAHKIAIKTNRRQKEALASFAHASRFAYNWGLDRWNELYKNGFKASANQVCKDFVKCKKTLNPWTYQVPKDACQEAIKKDLNNAFQNFFRTKKGFPKFKSRHKSKLAFHVNNDKFKLDGKRIKVPKLGWLSLREELRFSGRIVSGTFSCEAGRWFVSIQVDLGSEFILKKSPSKILGIDLGIKTALVTSDEVFLEGLRPLRRLQDKLRFLNKELSRRVKGSVRRSKTKLKLQKLHIKIKNIRKDWINKITTKLSNENQVIILEDLNSKGMLKNHKLALHISDVSFGEIGRQFDYKVGLRQGILHKIDRWEPSSKTCSSCGNVKKELKLSSRTYDCEACGLKIDRDLNASINIKSAGLPI